MKTVGITKYNCDICGNECMPIKFAEWLKGYLPIERYGILINITTFGIPHPETHVCRNCTKEALTEMIKTL